MGVSCYSDSMKYQSIVTATVITLLSFGAHAATGIQLLSLCQDNDSSCAGYIKAVADVLRDGDPVHGLTACIPDTVEMDQMIDVSVRWMEANPQKRTAITTEIISSALSDAFPCN